MRCQKLVAVKPHAKKITNGNFGERKAQQRRAKSCRISDVSRIQSPLPPPPQFCIMLATNLVCTYALCLFSLGREGSSETMIQEGNSCVPFLAIASRRATVCVCRALST